MTAVLASHWIGFDRMDDARQVSISIVLACSCVASLTAAWRRPDGYARWTVGAFMLLFASVFVAPWWPWSGPSEGNFVDGFVRPAVTVGLGGGTVLALYLLAYPGVRRAVPLCLIGVWTFVLFAAVATMTVPYSARDAWSDTYHSLPVAVQTRDADDAATRTVWYWSLVYGVFAAATILLLDWQYRAFRRWRQRTKRPRRLATAVMADAAHDDESLDVPEILEADPTPTTTE